jgi:predicted short-subunit dehydrogenase-like oxidoreductase (DUF2520 family)
MDVHVIGAGKLGTALAHAVALSNEYTLASVITTKDQLQGISCSIYKKITDVPEYNGMVFLCVPDDIINEVGVELLRSGLLQNDCIVAHVSGARGASELKELALTGTPVASFHPMQTFTLNCSSDVFDAIFVSIEGDKSACSILALFAKHLGAKPHIIDAQTKTALHIAGVMVSNFMSGLFLTAGDILNQSNAEYNRDFIRSNYNTIARNTLDNIIQKGFPEAITGPASRGDRKTIEQHLNSINDDNLKHLYLTMSSRLAYECLQVNHPIHDYLKSELSKL